MKRNPINERLMITSPHHKSIVNCATSVHINYFLVQSVSTCFDAKEKKKNDLEKRTRHHTLIRKLSTVIESICTCTSFLCEQLTYFDNHMDKLTCLLLHCLKNILAKKKYVSTREQQVFLLFLEKCDKPKSWRSQVRPGQSPRIINQSFI